MYPREGARVSIYWDYNQIQSINPSHHTHFPSSKAWTRFLSQSKCSGGGGEDGGSVGDDGDDGDGACGEGGAGGECGAGDGGVGVDVGDGGGGGVGGEGPSSWEKEDGEPGFLWTTLMSLWVEVGGGGGGGGGGIAREAW